MNFLASGCLVLGVVNSALLLIVYISGGRKHVQATLLEPLLNILQTVLLIALGSYTIHNCSSLYDHYFKLDNHSVLQLAYDIHNRNNNNTDIDVENTHESIYGECQGLGSLCIVTGVAYAADAALAVVAYRASRGDSSPRT